MTQVNQIQANQVLEIFNKKDPDYVLIDVREPEEWEMGVIPNIVKISLGDLEEKLPELDKSKKYIMVCRSGARSNFASSIMLDSGFSDVSNFSGGMISWEGNDFPVE